MTEIRNFLKTMNFTRSAAIFGGAGPLGAQIARIAGAFSFLVAAYVSAVPAAALAAEPLVVHQARIIGDEARTRIVLDFAEEPEFDVHYLDSPARIVVDFPAVNFAFPHPTSSRRACFRIFASAAWGKTAPASC